MTTSPAPAPTPPLIGAAAAQPGRRCPWRPTANAAGIIALSGAYTAPSRAPRTDSAVIANESASWPSTPFGGAPVVPHPLPENVRAKLSRRNPVVGYPLAGSGNTAVEEQLRARQLVVITTTIGVLPASGEQDATTVSTIVSLTRDDSDAAAPGGR